MNDLPFKVPVYEYYQKLAHIKSQDEIIDNFIEPIRGEVTHSNLTTLFIKAIDFNYQALCADDEMTASSPLLDLFYTATKEYFNYKELLYVITSNKSSSCASTTQSLKTKSLNPKKTRADFLLYLYSELFSFTKITL